MFLPLSIARERYAFCKSCEELTPVIRTCKKCNCFMPAKTTLAYAACPLGKWGPSTTEPTEPNRYEVED